MCIRDSLGVTKQVKSPGQLLKHYSPDTELYLNQNKPIEGDIFLSFGPHPKEIDGLTLTESKNLEEAHKLWNLSEELVNQTFEL